MECHPPVSSGERWYFQPLLVFPTMLDSSSRSSLIRKDEALSKGGEGVEFPWNIYPQKVSTPPDSRDNPECCEPHKFQQTVNKRKDHRRIFPSAKHSLQYRFSRLMEGKQRTHWKRNDTYWLRKPQEELWKDLFDSLCVCKNHSRRRRRTAYYGISRRIILLFRLHVGDFPFFIRFTVGVSLASHHQLIIHWKWGRILRPKSFLFTAPAIDLRQAIIFNRRPGKCPQLLLFSQHNNRTKQFIYIGPPHTVDHTSVLCRLPSVVLWTDAILVPRLLLQLPLLLYPVVQRGLTSERKGTW